ncbi:alpha/beta hydrolase [Sinomonas sp.]|uniref:alpha/beta hydrolase n=1 Tax=Sinomonas sp. TaxID=1914986 RepID=UPI002FE1F5EF
MPLDPQIRDIIRRCNEWDTLHGPSRSVEDERRRIAGIRASVWKPEMLPVRSIENISVPGAEGPIAVRVYRPEQDGPVPTVVYLHGGGWSVGGLDSHETHARRIANRAGAVVVAVDYRLAPEHRFPAGYEDCVAAYRWALDHIGDLGGDLARLGVAGDSAGGNLAAAVALLARDEGLPLAAQLLIYPATDMTTVYPSMRKLASGYFLAIDPEAEQGAGYLSSPDQRSDPRASPLLADLTGVAPAVVVVAEFDPIKDQGIAFAEKLQEAGTTVIYRHFPGLIHSFASIGASRAAVEASNTFCEDLAVLLNRRPVPRPAANAPSGQGRTSGGL